MIYEHGHTDFASLEKLQLFPTLFYCFLYPFRRHRFRYHFIGVVWWCCIIKEKMENMSQNCSRKWIYNYFSGSSASLKIGKRFDDLCERERAFWIDQWLHRLILQERLQFLQHISIRCEHKCDMRRRHWSKNGHQSSSFFHCLYCLLVFPCTGAFVIFI